MLILFLDLFRNALSTEYRLPNARSVGTTNGNDAQDVDHVTLLRYCRSPS